MPYRDDPVPLSPINMVLAVKQLRLDLSETLKRLQSDPRQSRERSLAMTHIQDAIHWLGEELKNLRPMVETGEEINGLARAAYMRYGKETDFKNFRGDPMPLWESLPEAQKRGWRAAVNPAGNPYPSSYDPTDPHVEEPDAERKIG